MEPYLERVNKNSVGDIEMVDAQKQEAPITVAELLGDMYYNKRSLDPQNVSLASSFICMLHIANEEGLHYEQAESTNDA